MPASCLGLAREDAQQARLAGAVQAHDQHPLAATDVEGDVGEDRWTAVALRQAVDHQHLSAAVRRRREPETHGPLPRRASHLARLELLHAGVQRLGLPRPLRRLPAHRVGERLQPADLLFLPSGEGGEPLLVGGPGGAVLRVGPAVLHDAVAVQVQDARDRGVQQRDVVAHDQERTAVRRQEPHQPVLRVGVQVVRGLVQQQEVGAAEEDARELQPPSLPARKCAHRQREPILRETQPRDDRPGLGLRLVAAQVPVLLLEPGEAPDVAVRVRLLQRDPRLLGAPSKVHEPPRGKDVLEARDGVVGAMLTGVLTEVPDRAPAGHTALQRQRLARQDFERARLAGAVATDHADLVAGTRRERQALHDRATPGLHGEVADLEGRHGAPPRDADQMGETSGGTRTDMG